MWILAVILVISGIPVAARTITGALHQVSSELEQAARISGANWIASTRYVLLPLLGPAMMTSFVLLFLLAARNLVLVLFFYTPDSRVLSTILWESWNGRSPERGLVAGVVMMALCSVALAIGLSMRRRIRVGTA